MSKRRGRVRRAVLDRITARTADPAFQAAVRRAVKANQRVFERLRRRDRPLPSLEDYLHTAAFVLCLPVKTIVKAVRLELSESALHAPQASWGVLSELRDEGGRAAGAADENHALPDGNKRTALATTIAFCDVNGVRLAPAGRRRPRR